MAGISFRGVAKAFGGTVAIPSLDLEIADGEFVSLLGPSGCGKTTLLRMLAGLEEPDAGTIALGDRTLNGVAPGDRDMAMVFQSYALYPHMSVAQNIAYPLKKRGVAKADRAGRVAEVAAMLQLEALLERKPRQLSGGQQQRVALGRALVREPAVFLFDEPLSNLDAKLRQHMRAEIIALHRRLGRTMVYVTHDQLEAMTMSTRIAVMRGGELQQFAAPAEVYARPANLFVAEFIGSPTMSILDGRVAGGRLDVAGTAMPASLPDGALKVGVRPEDVVVGTGDARARVVAVEPVGHETILVLQAGPERITARIAAGTAVADDMAFGFVPGRLHYFDADTGRRIDAAAPR
jgi:multiple sugar transport system ATP-binding protein